MASQLLDYPGLAVASVAIPVVGGAVSDIVTRKNIHTWYNSQRRAPWTPPNWVFAPVWTSLYVAMGYASFRVIASSVPFGATARSVSDTWYVASNLNRMLFKDARRPLVWYAGSLILNFAWTPLFFGAQATGLALIDNAALLYTIVKTTSGFGKLDAIAGRIMLPYLVWVSYALSLNGYVWLWNDDASDYQSLSNRIKRQVRTIYRKLFSN